jgi:hypothetical protein
MRNPSLHIRRSDLIKVLEKTLNGKVLDYEKLADKIFETSVPYQVKDRYLVKGNAETVKRAKRTVEASAKVEGYSAEQFNGLLAALRQQEGHRNMKKISKASSSEWNMLKEVMQLASEFVEAFGFSQVETGYKRFLKIGLDIMGRKFTLNKYKYYASKIHEQYESEKIIEDDDNEEGTLEFWQIWCAKMEEYTTTQMDILKPELFVNMIYGRQEADDAGANYDEWITAQFEELSFLTAVPELTQFHGDNAIHRHKKYKAKMKAPVKKTGKAAKEEEEIYNLPAGMSNEQEEYFKALRARKKSK